jgi:uncharacterized SAM-binding protein YcdF (DUF218 family)
LAHANRQDNCNVTWQVGTAQGKTRRIEVGGSVQAYRPRRRLFRALAWVIGFSTALALGGLMAGFFLFVATLDRSETMPVRHAEGAVALTGGADRITDALDLLAKGDADRLLISGVNPSTSGLEIARLAPQAQKLFDCCVELGYAAENTIGNALETRRWVLTHNIRSLIVVTSNYHMPRALAEIGHAVPGVELLAFPVVTERAKAGDWWGNSQRLKLVVGEYLKYVAALVRLRFAPAASVAL